MSFTLRSRCPTRPYGALRDRLLTVVFEPHDSSATHQSVIRALEDGDPQRRSALHRLADLALEAADALRTDDLAAQFRTHWTVPDLAPSGGVGCRPVG